MSNNKAITRQAQTVLSALTVLAGIWFTLEVGFGELIQVLRDSTLVNAATIPAYSGSIDFVDKVVTFTILATIIGGAGLGIYTTSTGSPKLLTTVEKNLPYIIGIVGVIGFWDIAMELLQGNRQWATFTDAENAYALFVATGMASGIMSFFGMKN